MPELMTFRAYARARGLNVSTVSRQVERGQIPVVWRGERRLIDPAAADRARQRNVDPSWGGKRGRHATPVRNTGESSPACLREIGAPFTATDNPVDEAMALMLQIVAQDVPELAARMAVAAGADMRTVYLLWASLSVALMSYTRHRGEEYGIRWRRPDEYWLPETPDWEELAKEAGEPVDVEAWKAYTKARSEERYGREN